MNTLEFFLLDNVGLFYREIFLGLLDFLPQLISF